MQAIALWPWEKATLQPDELAPGWLKPAYLTAATLLATTLIAAALYIPFGLSPALLLALPLGRLAALDLTTHTLPNVYTLPLIALGTAVAFTQGRGLEALLALILVSGFLYLLQSGSRRMNKNTSKGLGGGDVKLILAMFAFMPAHAACFAIGAGCLAWLPFGFWKPRAPQPFGVPLIMGWVAMLVWQGL